MTSTNQWYGQFDFPSSAAADSNHEMAMWLGLHRAAAASAPAVPTAAAARAAAATLQTEASARETAASSTVVAAVPGSRYAGLKVPALKAALRERGLPCSGNKPALVARLEDSDPVPEQLGVRRAALLDIIKRDDVAALMRSWPRDTAQLPRYVLHECVECDVPAVACLKALLQKYPGALALNAKRGEGGGVTALHMAAARATAIVLDCCIGEIHLIRTRVSSCRRPGWHRDHAARTRADCETSVALRRFRASGSLLGVCIIEALLAAGASAHTLDGTGRTPREVLTMMRGLHGCDAQANALDQFGQMCQMLGKPNIAGVPGALLRQLDSARDMLLRAEDAGGAGPARKKKKRALTPSGFPFKLPWE